MNEEEFLLQTKLAQMRYECLTPEERDEQKRRAEMIQLIRYVFCGHWFYHKDEITHSVSDSPEVLVHSEYRIPHLKEYQLDMYLSSLERDGLVELIKLLLSNKQALFDELTDLRMRTPQRYVLGILE
jgi:hypothetical protein